MTSIGRISSLQRYTAGRDNTVRNQSLFAQDSVRLNTGQRLLNNYDQLGGSKDLVNVTGRLEYYGQFSATSEKAGTELELAESSLNNMKEILDQIKVDALQGGNDTLGEGDLEVLGSQLRNFGENIYELANAKLGNRYLFGGVQSDKAVVTYVPNDLFVNATYKEGNADIAERKVNGIQSSIGLTDMFSKNAATAVYTGSVVTVPLTANAEFNFVVNDGTKDINVGDIALTTGDGIATIVTKINAAFGAAGGTGTIVQNTGGALDFDTALVTGNAANAKAAIIISPGGTSPSSLSDLGLTMTSSTGTSRDLRQALSELDSAYNSNDSARVRTSLVDIQANIDRLVDAHSKLGDLVSKFNDTADNALETKEALLINQSDIARLPVAEAIAKVNASQAILNATMQSASQLMRQNIFDFLSI